MTSSSKWHISSPKHSWSHRQTQGQLYTGVWLPSAGTTGAHREGWLLQMQSSCQCHQLSRDGVVHTLSNEMSQHYKADPIFVLILKVRKLSFREIKQFTCSHRTNTNILLSILSLVDKILPFHVYSILCCPPVHPLWVYQSCLLSQMSQNVFQFHRE